MSAFRGLDKDGMVMGAPVLVLGAAFPNHDGAEYVECTVPKGFTYNQQEILVQRTDNGTRWIVLRDAIRLPL